MTFSKSCPSFGRVICVVLVLLSTRLCPAQTFEPQEQARLHAIEMNKPATDFFEGGLLGNGGLGVVVCTRPDAVVLYLGHNDVWDIRVSEENRDKLVPFEELWGHLKRGTPEDDAWYESYRKMTRHNYAQPYPRPWPCGSILLGFDRRQAELLGHRVRIDRGVCEISFLVNGKPATLNLFVDVDADRVWMTMRDSAGQPTQAPFNRIRLIPEKGMETKSSSTADEFSFRQVLPTLKEKRDGDKALRVCVRSSARLEPGMEQHGPFVLSADLQHGLASAVSDRRPDGFSATMDAEARAASARDTSWKHYWSRSGVKLGDPVLERVWYRNLYFLNCSARPGVSCPGLFANWSYGNIGTAWHSDYHTNYNVQQPFWTTSSTNHVDKHLPYVDLVHFLLPISRDWAREHYKLPGAFFPHSAYPVEMTMMPYPVPPLAAEVCETPWVVQSLWWHYLYTMDAGFLRERAIVPIREAVRFVNAYMRRDEARGASWGDDKFHIYPTVVPELYGLKPDRRFCADCIVDLTLTKFVFRAYLEACRVLKIESQEAALMRNVEEILEHFPTYATAPSKRGTVLLSVSGESPDQVFNTPDSLAPVFPGEEIGLHSPPEQLELALNTWRNQQNEGGNDLVFLNLQGVRLGALDLEKFKRQLRYCEMPNGTYTDMVLQQGGRYRDETIYGFMARMGVWFENFALPVVINECLLQSYNGELRLFPNWPVTIEATFQDLRAVGAFLVSAEFTKGQAAWIRVKAEVGGPLRVINPWPGKVEALRADVTTVLDGKLLELQTKAGEIIRLSPQRD